MHTLWPNLLLSLPHRWRRWLWAGLLGALLACWLCPATAQAKGYEVELAYHLDASQGLTLAQVQALPEAAWRDSGSTSLSLGYTDAAAWFRIRVKARAGAEPEGLMEVSYPVLAELQVFAPPTGAAPAPAPLRMGALLPFEQRPTEHRNFVWAVSLQPGDTAEWWVRVVTPTALQFPLKVYERTAFERTEHWRVLAQGGYLGVVLAMLVYSLFLWIVSRDASYFWYIGWMLSYAGVVTGMAGFNYQWLWPESPRWNLISMQLMLALAAISGMLFFSALVRLKAHSGRAWRLILALVGLELVSVGVSLWGPLTLSIGMAIGAAVFSMTNTVGVAVWLALRQVAAARDFLKTFLVFVVGACTIVATKLGWLPTGGWLEYVPQISSALAISLFSLMLGARMEAERKLREHTQREMLEQQVRWNAELEGKVAERTDELKRLNHALAKLSRTDALTGLFNRRYLEECVDAELARCAKENLLMAIYMLDIDHFKRLNDSHGHAAGDECLRTVAQRLLACTRLGEDVLVRWGGEEFCLVALVWDVAAAAALGERLRASVCAEPVAHGEVQIAITASVGLAVGTPQTRLEMLDIQLRANESLYAAKATGRNRCVLAPVPSALGGLLPL